MKIKANMQSSLVLQTPTNKAAGSNTAAAILQGMTVIIGGNPLDLDRDPGQYPDLDPIHQSGSMNNTVEQIEPTTKNLPSMNLEEQWNPVELLQKQEKTDRYDPCQDLDHGP